MSSSRRGRSARPGVPGWGLSPGTRLLWRGDGSFQLERGPGGDGDAVVVAGLDQSVAARLARGVDRAGPVQAAHPVDVDALVGLAELGLVRPAAARHSGEQWFSGWSPTQPEATSAEPRECEPLEPGVPVNGLSAGPATASLPPPRLIADHKATSNRRNIPPGQLIASRQAAWVVVHGITRVSAHIGALLAASGVGHVSFASSGTVRLRDILPGGLEVADEGRRFGVAAARAATRAAADVDTRAPVEIAPDLTVVCADAPLEPELRALLHHRRSAHLIVALDAERGEVGPLVLPDLTPCSRCADLHRLDRDPAWTLFALQLLTAASTLPPTEPVLATAISALAVMHALAYLDGDNVVAAGGIGQGSWELRPGWSAARRRTRPAHPQCDCGASLAPLGAIPGGPPPVPNSDTAEWVP